MSEELTGRVARLEGTVASIKDDVGLMTGKIDKLVDGLSTTKGSVAERAQAVKVELRDEADRKAKDRSELFKNGLALVGSITLVVGAICGPYLSKLDSTAVGQTSDTQAIAAVREQLAQHGAEIARNRDSAEIGRDKNRWQDEQLLDLSGRVSRIEGGAARR